ncbi:alpha/beta fold hydrolase [Rhizobium lusitanum]|uniref:Pimeloyl-ACP methyl ester carboxylesterase n=1 Tax=Rhizobium lusitanum TaxID=293958 RepID=A0A7X0MA83_9HYPH|nr:alpha/beta hydrolase [Rhizobium lusitanum]MBB6483219.1 pimeloyl-ACP methyl ester carboxylesterase [Rhizobium lusitanum]
MRSDDKSGFLVRTIAAEDGLKLYVRDYIGDAQATQERPPIICLPGLTRNSRDFHQLAMLLAYHSAAPYRVLTLDARGRGRSERDVDKSHYNLVVETQDVVSLCSTLDIPKAVFIGTSRGGLVMHLLAASRPDLLKAAILNDIGPAIEKPGLAEIRDYLNRDRKPADRDDAVAILRENHGATFTALADGDWQDMAGAIYDFRDGKPVADYDPAIAQQLLALDFEAPLADLWPQFEAFNDTPLMVIRGENTKLLSTRTIEDMARRHPGMVIKSVAGQGHAPLLHLGDIPEVIRSFLSAL